MYWFLYDRDLCHESVKIELKAQFINEHSYESNKSCFKIELKAQFINEHSYESNKSC